MKNIFKFKNFIILFVCVAVLIFIPLKFNNDNYNYSKNDIHKINKKYDQKYQQELDSKRLIPGENEKIKIKLNNDNKRYEELKKENKIYNKNIFNIEASNYIKDQQKELKNSINETLEKYEENIYNKNYNTHQEIFNAYNDLQVLVQNSTSLTNKEKNNFISKIYDHKKILNNKIKNKPNAGIF